MIAKYFNIFLLACILSLAIKANGQERLDEGHTEVSMRMIGHKVLLSLGDSLSRVLPIEKVENRYKIGFEAEFHFTPEDLTVIIDKVVEKTGIASEYLVEVEDCESSLVVYSFEVGNTDNSGVVPCRTRDQPKACYSLFFTILRPGTANTVEEAGTSDLSDYASGAYSEVYLLIGLLLVIAFLLTGVLAFRVKKKSNSKIDADAITLGKFVFNKRKMELVLAKQKIELTSKESDLLQLLCESANDTVERDTILKMVWADEGDYIGRTLDVFISKLRKKLEADPNIKIANIRGVGYKLVVDSLS